jgi:hypothetical protein
MPFRIIWFETQVFHRCLCGKPNNPIGALDLPHQRQRQQMTGALNHGFLAGTAIHLTVISGKSYTQFPRRTKL